MNPRLELQRNGKLHNTGFPFHAICTHSSHVHTHWNSKYLILKNNLYLHLGTE